MLFILCGVCIAWEGHTSAWCGRGGQKRTCKTQSLVPPWMELRDGAQIIRFVAKPLLAPLPASLAHRAPLPSLPTVHLCSHWPQTGVSNGIIALLSLGIFLLFCSFFLLFYFFFFFHLLFFLRLLLFFLNKKPEKSVAVNTFKAPSCTAIVWLTAPSKEGESVSFSEQPLSPSLGPF